MRRLVTIFLSVIGIASASFGQAQNKPIAEERLTHVPEWAREAVWYQIFVERFRNGDTTNDPKPENIKDYIFTEIPIGWKITPWTQDWYKPDAWFANIQDTTMGFNSKVQYRRYGGDLQGVLEKLDYLKELGITAIYFNPLNDSPSLHKYDATYWHHVDRNFGPTPEKDGIDMLMENKDNAKEWVWTNADKLFLQVIKEAHKRGIKVIMDYSWNHTGTNFWAFQDVLKKGINSKYKDWYVINKFDNPQTEQNEFSYEGWSGVKTMPEIRKNVNRKSHVVEAYEGNLYSQAAKEHIFNVLRRWADPNGDGSIEDGIDGMRLDVAGEIPLGFWREFREVGRSINPEFYLIGEIWWEEWPDKLLDPRPFVKGDVFDANMNYRWYRTARHFFDDAPDMMSVLQFKNEIDSIFETVRPEVADAYMNMTSSHDAPRLLTSLYNKGKYKYHVNPFENPSYKINKPDSATYKTMEQLLIHQFTFVGSPQIWNGDEMGMWGADDPSDRKPLIWPDYKFDDEAVHPLGLPKPADKVQFDTTLFNFYKKIIKMRMENAVLVKGDYKFITTNGGDRILAYTRNTKDSEAIVIFNRSNQPQGVTVPARFSKKYINVLTGKDKLKVKNGVITTIVKPESSVVLIGNK